MKLNAISNLVALGVNTVVGFLLIPFILGCLGTEKYGIWTLVGTIMGYYGLLDFGVASAVMRYVARYVGRGDYSSTNEVVSGSLLVFGVVGAIVLCLTFLLAGPLATFFKVNAEDFSSFRQIVWLLGATTAVMLPGNVLIVVILGHERFVMANVLRILIAILRGTGTYYLLSRGGGLVALGQLSFALAIFQICFSWLIIKIWFKDIVVGFANTKLAVIKSLFAFGFFASIIHIGNTLRFKLDAVVVAKFLDMNAVGMYGIGAILYGYMSSSILALSGVTQPRLSAIAGRDMNEFKKEVMRYSNIVAVTAAGIGAVCIALVFDFLRLWVHKDISDPVVVAKVFIVLSAGLIPEIMTDVSKNALQAVKKHPFYAYQTILEGLANLVLSLLLVTKFGMVGVALGTAIPAVVTKILIQPAYCSRIFGIRFGEYLWFALIGPILVAVGTVSVAMSFSAGSYVLLVSKGIIVACIYAVFAFVFCLESVNKHAVWSYLRTVGDLCVVRK
ncbi:MAG: oligosaccharide flippase family protein [Sedimentisphaerales bacterium]